MLNGEKQYQEFLLGRVGFPSLLTKAKGQSNRVTNELNHFIGEMVNSVDSTFGFVVFIAPNEKDLRIMASKSNDRPHSASLDWNPGLGIIEEGAITSEIRNVITTGKHLVLKRAEPSQKVLLDQLTKDVNLNGTLQSALIIPLAINNAVIGLNILGEMRSWARSPFDGNRLTHALKIAKLIGDFLGFSDQLTVRYLKSILIPYIEAIEKFQKIVDSYQNREQGILKIKLISQNSPISVSLDGASAVIDTIKETIVPWRKEHARTMARLMEQEKQIEIEGKRAQVRKEKLEAENLVTESIKEHAHIERIKLENESLTLDLYQKKTKLALDIISRLIPNLTSKEREACLAKLLNPLEVLLSSELEIIPETIKRFDNEAK